MVSLNPDDGYFSCQVVDDEIGLSARPRSQSWSREHRGRWWGGWVQPELLCSVSTLRTVLLLSRGSQGGAIVPGSYSMAEHYSWVSVTFTERHHFPGGSDSKESAPNAGDPGSIPGLGRSPGEGLGNQPTPLQFSCLENSIDRGAWQAVVHGVPIELDTTECLTLSLSTERHKYISWFPSQLSIFLTSFLHIPGPHKRTGCQIVNF